MSYSVTFFSFDSFEASSCGEIYYDLGGVASGCIDASDLELDTDLEEVTVDVVDVVAAVVGHHCFEVASRVVAGIWEGLDAEERSRLAGDLPGLSDSSAAVSRARDEVAALRHELDAVRAAATLRDDFTAKAGYAASRSQDLLGLAQERLKKLSADLSVDRG